MAPPTEHLTVRADHGTTVLTVSGDLDLRCRDEAEAVLARIQADGADDVIVDLADLEFMDSTGVSTLMKLAHAVRRRAGRIRLRNASARDMFLLDVRGGLGLFDLAKKRR
ncbi:STAS domain-containing protein [Pseudactinotalea sp. Z1748]|uniref:STAS domain-containing protein n=1 Tax=Pseudactinotalea sp. Z1748 TaxID=3413027 RepID=UPI003C7BD987